jgi:biopolymer transport protein ExbD
MGRRAKGVAADASDVALNMTPMIDCVFQLLIFFMVCTDLSQKEIEQILLPNAEKSIEDKGDEEEKRVIINIAKAKDYATTKDISIKVKGTEYNLEQLKEILFTNAEIKRDEEDPNRPSEIYVLIRCDEEIRWREVQWVMQACADPAVRIYKLQFATREHKK